MKIKHIREAIQDIVKEVMAEAEEPSAETKTIDDLQKRLKGLNSLLKKVPDELKAKVDAKIKKAQKDIDAYVASADEPAAKDAAKKDMKEANNKPTLESEIAKKVVIAIRPLGTISEKEVILQIAKALKPWVDKPGRFKNPSVALTNFMNDPDFTSEVLGHVKQFGGKFTPSSNIKEQVGTTFKKDDIVIPNIGPHKGLKHKVIAVLGNDKYNIQPIGLKPAQIKYRLGAVAAKGTDLNLSK